MTIHAPPQQFKESVAKLAFLYADPGRLRYRAVHGGRGSAKSHTVADALVVHASTRKLRILCCREIQKSIKESAKRLIENKISDRNLGRIWKITETGLECIKTGSEFLFSGLRSNPDAIKSMEALDIAWIEEANRVSARSLELLRPTLRLETSEMWATWNPEKPTDPIDEFFRGALRPKRSMVVECNYYDNPFFPKVLREELEYDKRRDPEKYQWIWEGKYLKTSEARVFKNWTIGHVIVDRSKMRPLYGADWGFSNDPSVIVKVWHIPETRTIYIEAERYKVGLRIDDTPKYFLAIDDGEVKKWPVIADSARPETIDYVRRHGIPRIEAAKKGAGSVEDGITFMQSYDIVVNPECKHCIDELTLYSWKTDPLTGEVLPILEDKKNHVIDAIRYAIEKLRRATYGMLNVV